MLMLTLPSHHFCHYRIQFSLWRSAWTLCRLPLDSPLPLMSSFWGRENTETRAGLLLLCSSLFKVHILLDWQVLKSAFSFSISGGFWGAFNDFSSISVFAVDSPLPGTHGTWTHTSLRADPSQSLTWVETDAHCRNKLQMDARRIIMLLKTDSPWKQGRAWSEHSWINENEEMSREGATSWRDTHWVPANQCCNLKII